MHAFTCTHKKNALNNIGLIHHRAIPCRGSYSTYKQLSSHTYWAHGHRHQLKAQHYTVCKKPAGNPLPANMTSFPASDFKPVRGFLLSYAHTPNYLLNPQRPAEKQSVSGSLEINCFVNFFKLE